MYYTISLLLIHIHLFFSSPGTVPSCEAFLKDFFTQVVDNCSYLIIKMILKSSVRTISCFITLVPFTYPLNFSLLED